MRELWQMLPARGLMKDKIETYGYKYLSGRWPEIVESPDEWANESQMPERGWLNGFKWALWDWDASMHRCYLKLAPVPRDSEVQRSSNEGNLESDPEDNGANGANIFKLFPNGCPGDDRIVNLVVKLISQS